MSSERKRRNLIAQGTENFKPPLFKPNTIPRAWLENSLRRFVDLQGGTCWRDVRRELSGINGSLIDIGCGAQIYRDLVPVGVRYIGVDTADAKRRFGYDVPDTTYFEGDEWGVPDSSFDTALCTEVLEHIPEPDLFLGRVMRCLRPGGRLVMTVPFAARWHFVPHDYWRYTPSSLNMLLVNAGFSNVCVQARGNPLTVACYKVMTLIAMLLLGAEAGTARLAKRLLGLFLLPIFGLVACVANLSLLSDWGDDCLGYTVTAVRS